MIGLTVEEKKLVAVIARYHRKRWPDARREPFGTLPRSGRTRALKLIALLRLAIALDKERRGNVRTVRIRHTPDRCLLAIRGVGDLLLERWAVRKQAAGFEAAFGRTLDIA